MVKKSQIFRLWIEAEVYKDREMLPGHIRQRMKLALDHRFQQPRPPKSCKLEINDIDIPPELKYVVCVWRSGESFMLLTTKEDGFRC